MRSVLCAIIASSSSSAIVLVLIIIFKGIAKAINGNLSITWKNIMYLLYAFIDILGTLQFDSLLFNILFVTLLPYAIRVVSRYFSEWWPIVLHRAFVNRVFYREAAGAQVECDRRSADINYLVDNETLVNIVLAYLGYLANLATLGKAPGNLSDGNGLESDVKVQSSDFDKKYEPKEARRKEEEEDLEGIGSLPYVLPGLPNLRYAAFEYAPITQHFFGADFNPTSSVEGLKVKTDGAALASHLAKHYRLSLVPAQDRALEVEPGLFIRYMHTMREPTNETIKKEDNNDSHLGRRGENGKLSQDASERILMGDLLDKMNLDGPRDENQGVLEMGSDNNENMFFRGEFRNNGDDEDGSDDEASNTTIKDHNMRAQGKEGDIPRQIVLYCRDLVGLKESRDYLRAFRRRLQMGLEGVIGQDIMEKDELVNPLASHNRINSFLRRAKLWYRNEVLHPRRRALFLAYPVLTKENFKPSDEEDLEESHASSNHNGSNVMALPRFSIRRYPLPSEGTPGKTFRSLFFSQKKDVLRVLDDFKGQSGRFGVPGAPQHLNFLVYGPPGTGKTSLVKAIARYLGRHIVILRLGHLRTVLSLKTWMDRLVVGCSGEVNHSYYESSEISNKDSIGYSSENFITLEPREVIYLVEDADAMDAASHFIQRNERRGNSPPSPPHTQRNAIKESPLKGLKRCENESEKRGDLTALRKDTSFDDTVSNCRDVEKDEKSNHFTRAAMEEEEEEEGYYNVPNYSGSSLNTNTVLSVLNGVSTPPGRVVVITTNYPERLDSRLLRSGVITQKIPMEGLNFEESVEMIQYYFSKEMLTEQEVALIRTALQGFFGRERRANLERGNGKDNTKVAENRINPSYLEQICAECVSVSELVECLESGRIDFFDHLF